MDRGMSSAENVEWLQETGRRYLIGAPKSELKKWSREIADGRDWQTVRDGVEAKLCRGPDGTETFLLCRSADRREKERAMHERFSKRIEKRLESLGRRFAAFTPEAVGSGGHRAADRADARPELSCGGALSTSGSLDDCERDFGAPFGLEGRAPGVGCTWAIATAKGHLRAADQRPRSGAPKRICGGPTSSSPKRRPPSGSTRATCRSAPSGTRRPERVQAHILVCFLAYVLWKTLEQWQQRAGLGNSPRTILEEIGRIQSTDVAASRWPSSRVANSESAAWSAPTRPRRCCSIGWGSGSPSGCASPSRLSPKCSADSGPQVPGNPQNRPLNCGSWSSPGAGVMGPPASQRLDCTIESARLRLGQPSRA